MNRTVFPRAAALLIPLAAALAAGCDSATGPGGKAAGEPLKQLPRALSAAERAVIDASNDFAFGLLREVAAADTSANIFLSPLSATMALGMTMNGAVGRTQEEMRSALGFGALGMGDINASYRALIDLLLGLDASVDVRLANAIWARQGYPLHQSFFDLTRRYFDADAAALDFRDPASLRRINDWVKRGTGGRIDGILESIPDDVVMYLMNAVYFKGGWRQPFDPRQTDDAAFTRADGSRRTVRMMHRRGEVRHFRTERVEGVELTYGRDAYSMVVVLPAQGTDARALAASLDAATWQAWMGRMAVTGDVDVFLPRFTLEYELLMNDALEALGMQVPFDPDRSDFSGLSPQGRGLYISEVRQKTVLEVNEQGTEAAAVTSVAVVDSAPPQFRADRPFLVAIRERLSGTILFLGLIGALPA